MSNPSDSNNREKKSWRFDIPKSKWVRFGMWGIITIIFTLWTKSGWWLLALPLFFDLYISRLIPWGFWRNSKNNTFRSIMDWVDAIVFALAAVYVINIYFFQNYQIPSSSLEKSLLVGDFLFVSKMSYGPRVPNTPLAFPLAQHTLPVLNTKSYLDKPHWDYKRVPGFGKVKHNDIVVFNFPAGDTVPVNYQNPDYYTTCYSISQEYKISRAEAGQYVRNHPETFGKVVYRPVDRRENYVKRCIGLPGETIRIMNNQVFINGKPVEDQPGVQYNYFVQTKGSFISDEQFRQWGVSKDDRYLITEDPTLMNFLPFKKNKDGSVNPIYHFPATRKLIQTIKNSQAIDTVIIEPDMIGDYQVGGTTYPLNDRFKWSRDHFGPLWIPAKGATIHLTADNLILYERVIRNYEGQQLEIKNGVAFIDGKKADNYTFKMDYYWMMGDNRHNSADCRAWGFVPEDHIVGKPICVWLSLDKDRGWFDGKIRWNRFFKKAY
ncbi:MAG: S26 family signal peptidase [Bacteroidales bacterium]|nr:S26 family signal peptidase [Bacteroidales bacterium]